MQTAQSQWISYESIGLLNMNKVALIIGAGPGITASFVMELVTAGYTVALAFRDMEKLRP